MINPYLEDSYGFINNKERAVSQAQIIAKNIHGIAQEYAFPEAVSMQADIERIINL